MSQRPTAPQFQFDPMGLEAQPQASTSAPPAAAPRPWYEAPGQATSGPGGISPTPIQPSNPYQPGQPRTGQMAPFAGTAPKHRMEGFDFSREQDVAKSAKDAFAHFANQAPPPPLNDKTGLSVWFKTYIQPGMQQMGHNVTDVDGDKFRFNNWQGDFWVDYGRGAGAEGGALAWQADYAQGGPASQAYNHTQNAIMGVPRQQAGGGSFSQAVLQPMQPQGQQTNPDMAHYYDYLQQLMGQEQR